jgi:hypothetical protein
MGVSLILALCVYPHLAAGTPVSGGDLWEELPPVQKLPAFHPSLRFKPSSTYMFATPDFIQQGKYQVIDNHYYFRAIMASELENSDVNKLAPDMGEQGQKFREAYARSMSNFEGDYNESAGTLTVFYPVNGKPGRFELHMYTEGDNLLTPALTDSDRGMPGLWHAPEPFPDMLDARTRYKIGGLEGLQQFFKEAGKSDGAQFAVLDLRVDKSYRYHGILGRWQKNGQTVILKGEGGEIQLTLSADGQKLMSGGKASFIRN